MSDSSWPKMFGVLGLVLGIAASAVTPGTAEEVASVRAKQVGHATINEVLINGRNGGRIQPATVRPGSPITVHLDFKSDSSQWCPKCSNQLVIGYARRQGNRLERLPGGKCVFSSSGKHHDSRLTFRMSAPAQPGRYEVIVSAPQAYNCTKALRWRARPYTVARLQVRN